jgi:hypothetical protein
MVAPMPLLDAVFRISREHQRFMVSMVKRHSVRMMKSIMSGGKTSALGVGVKHTIKVAADVADADEHTGALASVFVRFEFFYEVNFHQ